MKVYWNEWIGNMAEIGTVKQKGGFLFKKSISHLPDCNLLKNSPVKNIILSSCITSVVVFRLKKSELQKKRGGFVLLIP